MTAQQKIGETLRPIRIVIIQICTNNTNCTVHQAICQHELKKMINEMVLKKKSRSVSKVRQTL